jgi:hypothetical protein
VGGRSFTSTILQKNCHEFIAYENLIAPQGGSRRPAERTRAAGPSDTNLSKALPVVRRALKVLSDREVSPQLGLLKSTLLQLDSTFSERDYGASTFRDFIEKMAAAGYVNLKQVDRSLLVELKESAHTEEEESQPFRAEPAPVAAAAAAASVSAQAPPAGPTPAQLEEGVRALFDAFQHARTTPHWPMYLRNVKQYVKNAAPNFDERRYGFANFLEAVRAAGRAGLFRLERNRQGILRIFAGNQFPRQLPVEPGVVEEMPVEAAPEHPPVVEEAIPVGDEELVPGAIEEELPVAVEAEPQPEAEEVGGEQPRAPAARRRTRAGMSPRKKPAAKKAKKKTPDSEIPF